MILDLVYYDNFFLRKKAHPIEKITDEIKQLAKDMIETMDAKNGIGLAGNQVGKLLRIIVIRPAFMDVNGEYKIADPEVYINPRLLEPSKEREILSEGCLSFPGLHFDVERPLEITVEASDLEGKSISERVRGFKARELMHENDHLNGVLFIDRIPAFEKQGIAEALKEIKSKYNS